MALTRVINSGIGVAASIAGEATASTNLQQGLCKAWAHTTQASSYVLDDSFNIASIADAGTGKTTININNDMASANYVVGGCCTQESVVIASVAAGSFEGRSIANDGSLADSTDFTISVHGDLA
jgi:hypothetical protein|tara:strand:+ start:619 stop:990 length:372 start_codon:yes stop_codon:yes gene_type:complete